MFKKNDFEQNREYQIQLIDKTESEIERLTKKYQERPDTLITDYDNSIKNILIGIIANINVNSVVREDIITSIDILIRNREFIIKYYSNDSSSNNQK